MKFLVTLELEVDPEASYFSVDGDMASSLKDILTDYLFDLDDSKLELIEVEEA